MVPTSTVTSVTNWAPVCTVPGQPRAACAAWLGAGMNAVATLASAMLAHCNERNGFLRPPFTIAICPEEVASFRRPHVKAERRK